MEEILCIVCGTSPLLDIPCDCHVTNHDSYDTFTLINTLGFLCPVHTPDGAPCGLLNHLAAACRVTTTTPNTSHLPRLLTSIGMTPLGGPRPFGSGFTYLPVVLDGRLIGEVEAGRAQELAAKLRMLKILRQEKVNQRLLDRSKGHIILHAKNLPQL